MNKTGNNEASPEEGMSCIEFARAFLGRTNHPGFKIVVSDCIDEIEQLTEAIKSALSFLQNSSPDICMCGALMDMHDMTGDHAPLSEHDRYCGEIVEMLKAALGDR